MSLSARILPDHFSQSDIEKQILSREEQLERILGKRAQNARPCAGHGL